MQYILRAALLAMLAVPAATGAFAQEWSEWIEIGPQQSYLHLATPPNGLSTEDIHRRESLERSSESRQEVWSWESGALHVWVLGGRYATARRGRGDLLESIGQWDALGQLGFQANKADVERGSNKLGVYYYASVKTQRDDVHCFVFLQNLRNNVAAGYQTSANQAGGVITGFDCQNENTVPFAEHADVMKTYIKGLSRQ